jgi:hypothetical protein
VAVVPVPAGATTQRPENLILTDALQAVMRMLITSFSNVQSDEPPTL